MTPRRSVVKLVAGAGLVPPARFRLWKAGPNPGDYGNVNFTPAAAASVMGEYQRRGNALVMDIEHALNRTVNPTLSPNDPPPTAGYTALELVDTPDGPELWLLPRWSDCGRDAPVPDEVCCAKHQIQSGQRCYVSPDWDQDTETGEPIRLNRVSLVAEPATWGINLLASRAGAAQGKTQVDEKQIRAAYALASMQAAAAEGPLKETATAYAEQLKGAAAAMGVDLEKEPEAAPESERAEGQAKKAAAESAQPSEPAKPEATAAVTASKPVTMAEVRREMAEQTERQTLLAGIKDRVPTGHTQLVASMGLTQLRAYARGLPATVSAGGKGGATTANVTAGKGGTAKDEELTYDEKSMVRRWGSQLEIKPDHMTASREAWKTDPVGGEMTVDPFKHLLRGTTGRSAAKEA